MADNIRIDDLRPGPHEAGEILLGMIRVMNTQQRLELRDLISLQIDRPSDFNDFRPTDKSYTVDVGSSAVRFTPGKPPTWFY